MEAKMKKEEILKRFEGGEFMSLTLEERRAVAREVVIRYNKVRKKERYLMNLFILQVMIDVMHHMC